MIRLALLLGIIAVVALVVTNPDSEDFRAHIRERDGIAGTVGLAVTDALSGPGGGIQRANYLVASRFYVGGDGVLPRQDLGWGAAGLIFDVPESDR